MENYDIVADLVIKDMLMVCKNVENSTEVLTVL